MEAEERRALTQSKPRDAVRVHAVTDDAAVRAEHSIDRSGGIMQSSTHWLWFVTKCSKLTERFRYTPESVFDTFTWPQTATVKQIDAVAAAARELRRVRAEALPK